MFDITIDTYRPTLSTVTSRLVDAEMRRQTNALVTAASNMEADPEVSRFIANLLAVQTLTTPAELVNLAIQLTQKAEQPPAVNQLRDRSACLVLFYATILEVFDDNLTQERLIYTDLDKLAVAQRHMSTDSTVAWDLLTVFRKDFSLAPFDNQSLD